MPPTPPFFPDPVFGWIFSLALIAFTVYAAVNDTRRAIIPNRLTVTILLTGLLFNLVRSGWLGAQGRELWALDTGSVWLGIADGLLFSLAGFATAFVLMFVFWVLGLCGGGDLKLFAAVGTWLGWHWFIWLWIASVAVLWVWTAGRVVFGGLAAGSVRKRFRDLKQVGTRKDGRPQLGKLRMTYSLPIAVATAIVVLWANKYELQLTAPKPAPDPTKQGSAHVPPSRERA